MAIARDTYGIAGRVTGLTRTLSYTCSGANRLLLVWIEEYGTNQSDNITGVTYNGVSMTRIAFPGVSGGSALRWYLYSLVAPATGTHDIVATGTISGDQIGIYAVSYTGCKQSAPEVVVTQSQNNTTPITLTLTTLTANAFFVGGVVSDGATPNANSNCTVISNSTDNFNVFEYNSNPVVTPGSVSMVINVSSANSWSTYGAAVSLAPAILISPLPTFYQI